MSLHRFFTTFRCRCHYAEMSRQQAIYWSERARRVACERVRQNGHITFGWHLTLAHQVRLVCDENHDDVSTSAASAVTVGTSGVVAAAGVAAASLCDIVDKRVRPLIAGTICHRVRHYVRVRLPDDVSVLSAEYRSIHHTLIWLSSYSPNSTCCVTSRHVTTRQARRVVRVVTWRDVLCRACCTVLAPTWRTTKNEMKLIRLLKRITAILTLYALQTKLRIVPVALVVTDVSRLLYSMRETARTTFLIPKCKD